ncbi:hypothetical protein BGY98DRAFT_1026603 [Russula aff. rugulosa BPL654]|nr:hypothetical protein BGY98DRAFT_1026603 [Russula aff. rugulosa BPL654]
MAEIRGFYKELNKFWREEICHVLDALKNCRVDPKDFERWKSFRSSLNLTIEFWKVCFLPLLHARPIKYYVQNGHKRRYSNPTQQLHIPFYIYVAFAANSDLCLSVLRNCASYGEKVFTWCFSFNASPISRRLLSEATGSSTESDSSVEGSRRFKTTYKKASALEQKVTSELNTLLESLSSWVAAIDGPSDDAPIDVVHPQELGELKCVWEKTRDSLRSALEILTSESVHHHRSSWFHAAPICIKVMDDDLVCFS